MQSCPRCSTSVIDENRVCNNCEMSMEQVICPSCTTILEMEADICDSCGYYLNREFIVITEENLENEQLINNRYRVLDNEEKLIKDTLPNYQTFYSTPVKNSQLLDIYKRLSKHSAIPRIFDAFCFNEHDFILLQQVKDNYGQDYRNIREAWADITDREKLQLLRDWAALFQILEKENTVSSVLNLQNIFVDNDINLKLKIINIDAENSFSIKNLGELWLSLMFAPNTSFLEYSKYKVGEITKHLVDGKIESTDELFKKLDALLEKPVSEVIHFAATNVGKKRMNNEDNFYAATIDLKENGINRIYNGNRGIYVVCDGMGGHESGEVASATAVSSIRTSILPALAFSLGYEDIKKLLEDAIINQANESIYQINEAQKRQLEKRMGTTIVIAVVIDNKLYTAHVGDSRIYMINKDSIEQVTEDHNVAMKNYRDGIGTLEDAINNTKTHWGKVLTQALGPKGSEFIYPEVNYFNLKEDSYLILCSDGLTDMVPLENIEASARENWEEPQKVVEQLIEKANNNGGRDNITVIGVKISMLPPVFPIIDYSELFYSSEIDVNDEIMEMVDSQEKNIEGLNIDPEEKAEEYSV